MFGGKRRPRPKHSKLQKNQTKFEKDKIMWFLKEYTDIALYFIRLYDHFTQLLSTSIVDDCKHSNVYTEIKWNKLYELMINVTFQHSSSEEAISSDKELLMSSRRYIPFSMYCGCLPLHTLFHWFLFSLFQYWTVITYKMYATMQSTSRFHNENWNLSIHSHLTLSFTHAYTHLSLSPFHLIPSTSLSLTA